MGMGLEQLVSICFYELGCFLAACLQLVRFKEYMDLHLIHGK